MTIREIIEKHLKDNGFDGLASDECGCLVGDLCPCQLDPMGCEPGYLAPCNCGDHEWHICTESPNPQEGGKKP